MNLKLNKNKITPEKKLKEKIRKEKRCVSQKWPRERTLFPFLSSQEGSPLPER